MKYGICHLGIIPLRAEKNHRNEMISQILYGEFFKIIDERKDWIKIRNNWDAYEGWISRDQATLISKEEYTLLDKMTPVFSSNLVDFITLLNKEVFSIPLGSDLRGISLLNHSFSGECENEKQDKNNLIKTASLFLHTPYLWGGKSLSGIDCSGFSQLIYRMNGVKLKRDAPEQANQGEPLSFIEESEPGDLAFFDNDNGEVIHVGMLLKNGRIIHASGKVRIDHIDQTGIFNSDTNQYSHKLRTIKKIF